MVDDDHPTFSSQNSKDGERSALSKSSDTTILTEKFDEEMRQEPQHATVEEGVVREEAVEETNTSDKEVLVDESVELIFDQSQEGVVDEKNSYLLDGIAELGNFLRVSIPTQPTLEQKPTQQSEADNSIPAEQGPPNNLPPSHQSQNKSVKNQFRKVMNLPSMGLEKEKANKRWMAKVPKLEKKISGKKKSQDDGSQLMTQEKMAVIVEDPAPLKSNVAEKEAAAFVKDKVASKVEKSSSSLLDRDDDDEEEGLRVEQLIEGEPERPPTEEAAPTKRKPLGLSKLLRLGACTMNPSTRTELNTDRAKKSNDYEAAPKGLLSCGVANTARKDGIFDGLTSVQSDAAISDPSLDEEEMKTMTKQIHRSSSEEKNVIKLKTNAFHDYEPHEPHRRRLSPAPDTRDIKVNKSNSKEHKPAQRASPAPGNKETKVEKTMKKTESNEVVKAHHRAAPVSKQDIEKKPVQSELVDQFVAQLITRSSSSLLEDSSTISDESFVGHMEAKFDLYHQKFGLIQKFGCFLDQLKKKQAEVQVKELEVEEAQEAVEKATKVSTLKKRKKELAILQEELAILRKEEEAAKVPVARLYELLNAQLDTETMKTVDAEAKSPKFDATEFFFRVTACNNDGTIVNKPTQDEEEVRVKEPTFDHILDVICG
jgi:hypothetical protein